MEKLNAVTLKDSLWKTLNEIRNRDLEASAGDAIASQAREILRAVRTQVTILDKANIGMSDELVEFAKPKKTTRR